MRMEETPFTPLYSKLMYSTMIAIRLENVNCIRNAICWSLGAAVPEINLLVFSNYFKIQ